MKTVVAIIVACVLVGICASCNGSAQATSPATLMINGIEMTVTEDQLDEQYNCRTIVAERSTTSGAFWKGTRVVDGKSYPNCYCIQFPDDTVQGCELVQHDRYATNTSATITVVKTYPMNMQNVELKDLVTQPATSTTVKLFFKTHRGNQDLGEQIQGVLHYGRKATQDNPINF